MTARCLIRWLAHGSLQGVAGVTKNMWNRSILTLSVIAGLSLVTASPALAQHGHGHGHGRGHDEGHDEGHHRGRGPRAHVEVHAPRAPRVVVRRPRTRVVVVAPAPPPPPRVVVVAPPPPRVVVVAPPPPVILLPRPPSVEVRIAP